MLVRWYNRPRLRFTDTQTPPEGTAGVVTPVTGPDGLPVTDPAPKADGDPDDGDGDQGDPGFPQNTAPEDMTSDQRAAFWKNQSRKNERKANKLKAEKDAADAAAAEAAKTDEQRREDELRRDGEALGAAPWIKRTVRAELRAATGLAPADVDELLRFTDPNAFLKDGTVDDGLISDFAARVANGKTPTGPSGPPASVLAGLGATGAPRGGSTPAEGGSLRDKKQAARERLESKGAGRRKG